MLMRILKILIVIFGFLLISPNAFAQSEPVQPKFGIGISLGLPSSIHFLARDVVNPGLGLRIDFGGLYFLISYLQIAINLEYHIVSSNDGLYFGLGLVGFEYLFGWELSPENVYKWKLGGQVYVGIGLEPFFLEIGAVQLFNAPSFGSGGFFPRAIIGFNFYF